MRHTYFDKKRSLKIIKNQDFPLTLENPQRCDNNNGKTFKQKRNNLLSQRFSMNNFLKSFSEAKTRKTKP